MRWSWLRTVAVAAAVTLAWTTSSCIRFGYDPVKPVRDLDDAKPSEPRADSGAGGGFDAEAQNPPEPEDAGATRLEEAGMLQPEDAGILQPGDSGMLQPEDAGATPPEDAGATLSDDAGTTQPDEPYDGAVNRDCGTGVELADACWYLGALGASCAQACANHGGYIAAASYVGVAAEGGTLAHCDMLLDLLVGPGETTSGTRDDGSALGCHLYEGARWWLNSGPAFDPRLGERYTQIVCSCNGP